MSCYLRHIKDIFAEIGIEISPSNKKKVDQLLHDIVGIEYKNCSKAWSKIKELQSSDTLRAEFIEKLKRRWAEGG